MTDFTGSDSWHTTITGPSAAEDVTHLSVVDMGVLLADREIWLKNRLVGCGRILEHAIIGTSSLLGSLIDLKTSTTYTLIPGIQHTLAEAADVGDIIIVHASMQVLYQGDALGTDYLKIAVKAPNLGSSTVQGATVRVVSNESPSIVPVHIGQALLVTGSDGGTEVGIYGACATGGGNTFATVYSPWAMSVTHIRPIAAP